MKEKVCYTEKQSGEDRKENGGENEKNTSSKPKSRYNRTYETMGLIPHQQIQMWK